MQLLLSEILVASCGLQTKEMPKSQAETQSAKPMHAVEFSYLCKKLVAIFV